MGGVKSDPEDRVIRQQFVRVIGRVLWKMNLEPEQDNLSSDEIMANWKEHKATYMQAARRITRKLEQQGFRATKIVQEGKTA